MKRIGRILLMGLVFTSIALDSVYAESIGSEGCIDLSENETWTRLLAEMADDITAKRYQAAEEKAMQLDEICSRSPILNYTKGKLAEAQNDTFHARMYYQMASENTYELATSAETARKIWYARYEFEHPDRTEAAVLLQNETMQTQETKIAELNGKLEADAGHAEMAMWTGAGIGIGGIAVMTTGIALLASSDAIVERVKTVSNSAFRTNKVSSKYRAGWSMTGIGAGLAIAGAIVTGIFGYEFTHQAKDETISVQFTSTTLTVQF